jgi:hypothetical protein
MRNEVLVKRDELYRVYQALGDALETLQLVLAEVGCTHINSQNVTTMADVSAGVRKHYCSDCDQLIEEEIGNDLA